MAIDPKWFREMLEQQQRVAEEAERALASWRESMKRMADQLPTLEDKAGEEWQRQMTAIAASFQQMQSTVGPHLKALQDALKPQLEAMTKTAAAWAPMYEAANKAMLAWASQFEGLDKIAAQFRSMPKTKKD